MSEERYNRNEIIADDLADESSKRSTSNIRSRINREVVRIDDKPSPFIDDDEEISEENIALCQKIASEAVKKIKS